MSDNDDETAFKITNTKLYVLLSVDQMGSNNNDILEGLSIVDKYVQIALNK